MAALGELLTSLTSSKKFEEQKGTRDRHVSFFVSGVRRFRGWDVEYWKNLQGLSLLGWRFELNMMVIGVHGGSTTA